MAAPPRLDDDEMMLLKVLASRPDYLRGGEAMRMLNMDRQPFVDLVAKLASKNLLQVSGSVSPETIDFATLAVHPSNFSFVRSL
jgi:hypothetical protein